MSRDVLFLLPRAFEKDGRQKFCPPCALIEGFLSWHPDVAERLDVRRVDFPRPRTPVVERLGEGRQNCPVLILAEDAPDGPGVQVTETGVRYVDDGAPIARYLAERYGKASPLP